MLGRRRGNCGVHDGSIEHSACCFLSDSITSVEESLFNDAGSTPCGDVLGCAVRSMSVAGRVRRIVLVVREMHDVGRVDVME